MAASFMEVPVDPCSSCGCSNTIVLSVEHREETSIGSLEGIYPDSGGGFSYTKDSKITRQRQIIWKVIGNIVKLEEISLGHNLFGNKLEIHIPNEIILSNVIIKESEEEVNVFIATTRTIHQLIFVHPNHCKYGFIIPSGIHVAFPSVFNNASEEYKHRSAELSQLCTAFDVTCTDKEVYFGLVTVSKTLLVANLTDAPEESSCIELKDASVMQRLWTGLVPSFVRGDSTWMGVESVIMHSFGPDEIFAFTLCKDLKMRVWSAKRQCCVLTKDLASLIPETEDSQPEMVGALSVKKANTPSSKQLILAAHCCFAYSSKFIVLEVFKEQRDVVIMHVSNFYSCFNSIQDVSLTSHFLCVLWNTPDGGHSISYAPIEGGKDYEKGWHPVHTKQSDKEDLFIPMYQDAKEVYLEKIFSPGTFNKESILKALQVFIKTLDIEASEIPGANTEVAVIKEAIIRILELEIERNVITRDIHPSDYQELQHQCWLKYFSFVQQCYQAREKPLGLYMSESEDLSMVIRQEACGYLHNTDWIDHLYLTELDSCEDLSSYIENEIATTNESISQDIMIIMKCLKSISDEFTSDVILGIDYDLDRNADVKSFLTSMAATLLTNNSDFEQLVGDPIQRGRYLSQLEDRLKHIQNPEKSIEVLMAALQSPEPAKMPMFDQTDSSLLASGNNSQFLCGKIGIDLLTQLLKQIALNRMHFCRDLFILLKLMDKIGLSRLVSPDFGTIISNSCYELLRSYHAVYWSAKTIFVKAETSTIDSNLNLAALHLGERSRSSTSDTSSVDDLPVSLLASFVRNVGMKKLLEDTNMNMMKMGDYSKPEMIKFVMKAILHHVWVLNGNVSDFPEYLSGESQNCALMDYLHFCDQWCSAGRGTKDYLLAQAYLGIGEPYKALSYFFTAARGISMKEPLLMSLIDGDSNSRERYLAQYFIKVMRLFEQFEYPTYVISAATSALTVATKQDPSIPMLWSVIFKYYLELGHYSDAYATIVHNTDKIRRHDCLRHFIATLCDAGLFQEICSFPYTNLEEEVVNIIESRARTTDITVNRYYDLLYSYHVIKCDYRRASTAMYEHACRLQTEMHGTKALQKQAKCYLAAITALKLVKAKDAWIVRPQVKLSTVENKQPDQQYSQSPKRRDDGEVVFYSTTKKKKCGMKALIVEIAHLEKEYLLIFSRLKLVQNKKTDNITLGPSMSAAETVGLLAQAGLFDIAFSVALKFELPLKHIFESLAAKCAQLVNHKPSELDEQWKWLSKNELCTSQILTITNATDQAFHLLQAYLKRFQKGNSSVHYKAVTSKFISMGCCLPSWLITLYEQANPSELLHVYLCYDMVSEATQLALKYIDAVLGHGKEYLGLNTALHATAPAVWLPFTSFDQLLTALRANYEKPEAAKLCGELQDKLDDYFIKSEIVSCDKLNYLYTVNNSMAIK